MSAAHRKYYAANREKVIARSTAWAAAHPDRVKEIKRACAAGRRDKDREWRKSNAAKLRKSKRDYYRKNKAKEDARVTAWVNAHRDRKRQIARDHARRKNSPIGTGNLLNLHLALSGGAK